MRIIAGTWKGRRLAALPTGVRPTSDRLREAIFSHLGESVAGSVWLDVFAGSGAIGLEALSRGARFVYFNEPGGAARRLLERNLELCGLRQGYRLSQLDALAFLRRKTVEPIDFIYLDPPYHEAWESRLLARLEATPCLQPATVLLEHFKKVELSIGECWQRIRTLRAGDSLVEVLRRIEAGPGQDQ